MGKEQCSSYCIFRSSREGYWMSLRKKKKKNCARQKLEWLLPISSTRSRPSLEVATCRGRDQEVKSRPGLLWLGRNDVATWAAVWEVATWKRCHDIGEASGGRDLEKGHRDLAWGLGRRNDVATPI